MHGWGRAVDFEDAGGELTFDSVGYHWLKANAGRFGFVHPAWAEPGQSSSEPWHWEHAMTRQPSGIILRVTKRQRPSSRRSVSS